MFLAELMEENTDFFTFDFANNFQLHVEAEFYASDEHCHETRVHRCAASMWRLDQ